MWTNIQPFFFTTDFKYPLKNMQTLSLSMLYPLCADTLTKSSTEVGKWHNIAKTEHCLGTILQIQVKSSLAAYLKNGFL